MVFKVECLFRPSVHRSCHVRRMNQMIRKIKNCAALMTREPITQFDISVDWNKETCSWIIMKCTTNIDEASVVRAANLIVNTMEKTFVKVYTDSTPESRMQTCQEAND